MALGEPSFCWSAPGKYLCAPCDSSRSLGAARTQPLVAVWSRPWRKPRQCGPCFGRSPVAAPAASRSMCSRSNHSTFCVCSHTFGQHCTQDLCFKFLPLKSKGSRPAPLPVAGEQGFAQRTRMCIRAQRRRKRTQTPSRVMKPEQKEGLRLHLRQCRRPLWHWLSGVFAGVGKYAVEQ